MHGRLYVTGSAKTEHNSAIQILRYKALKYNWKINNCVYFKKSQHIYMPCSQGANSKSGYHISFAQARGAHKSLFDCSGPKEF